MYHPVIFAWPAGDFTWVMFCPSADTSLNTDAPPVVASAIEKGGVTSLARTTGAEADAVVLPFGLLGLYAILFCFYIINQFNWSLTRVSAVYWTGRGAVKLPSIVSDPVVLIVTVPVPVFLI